MPSVAERLEAVRQRVARAAERAARDPATVRLVAVSKTQPPSAILEAHAAGQRDFGENYVQELSSKVDALRGGLGIRWHLVGHLQRNKARLVVRAVDTVQTVDSVELARELGKRFRAARDAGEPSCAAIQVFVEVNIADEPQKHGAHPEAIGAVLAAVEAEEGLRLRGLMCVPPAAEDPSATRPHFQRLFQLRHRYGGVERLPELSMGMSGDFEEAVLAGATLVRVGTAIFGDRPAKTL